MTEILCPGCGSHADGQFCGRCGARLPSPWEQAEPELDWTLPRSAVSGPPVSQPTRTPPSIRYAAGPASEPASAWPVHEGSGGWGPSAPPPPPPRRSPARWLIPLAVLFLLGGFGAAVAVTGLFDGSGTKTATGSQTPGASQTTGAAGQTEETPTDVPPSAVTETVTEAPSAGPPPVTLPREAEVCRPVRPHYGPVAYAARGNSVTSCAFSLNVQEAYVAAGGVDGRVIADSPVTKKTYTMECTGTQPVVCRGGNNAVVLLFEGEPKH